MNIRELNTNDYETVYGFIVNEMEHPEVSFADMSVSLDNMRNDVKYLLYVAVHDNQVVGFVSAAKMIGCIDSNYIEITCLVVSDNYQRIGVGKLLLEHIESLGKRNNIGKFSTTSGLHRKAAHDFYIKNGYEIGGLAFYNGQAITDKSRQEISSVDKLIGDV